MPVSKESLLVKSLLVGLHDEFDHLSSEETGLVKRFTHRVDHKLNVTKVAATFVLLPSALQEQVSAELQHLEKVGIMEKVDASEWISPVVVVRKKDGSIRLCVDLGQANKTIFVDDFPLPHTTTRVHTFLKS